MISHVHQESNGQLASENAQAIYPHPATGAKSTLLRPVTDPLVSLSTVQPDELEMLPETPPDSRVLIIRNPESTWVPNGPTSLPPHCSLGMPYDTAAALACELNRYSMIESSRAHSWHVVISRQNKSGYAVMRVMRSANWIPQDEYDVPPDASESMFNCAARKEARDFNHREMQLNRSPEFWAIHIKPLKKGQSDKPKLNVSRNDTRVIHMNGRSDIRVVVQGVFSDKEAVQKVQDEISVLLRR